MTKESSSVATSAAIVAFFTAISRVAGLFRDLVISHIFGAGALTDAFFVAFTIPNMMRRIVAEGALTVAFVPLYAETRQKEGDVAARDFLRQTFGLLLLVLCGMVVLGILGAKYLVYLLASGFSSSPDKFQLTVTLTQTMFVYIFFVSLVALSMGVLNSHKHFAAPAASPIVLNLSIAFFAIFSTYIFTAQPIFALAIGVVVGGISQLLLQIPVLMRMDLLVRPSFNFNSAPLKRLMRMMVPALFGIAVYQVNLIVLRQYGSFMPEGQITYYYIADRLMQFALGIFATSIATASLPTLSIQTLSSNNTGMINTFLSSLRLGNLINIPAASGLMMIAIPIVSVLYHHGKFDWYDVEMTSYTVMAFAPGLISVSMIQITVQVFYALKDMRTPVIIGAVSVGCNALIGYLLLGYQVIGLGATISISSWLQFFMLLYALHLRMGELRIISLFRSIAVQLLLSAISVLPAYLLCFYGVWHNGPTIYNLFILLSAIGIAMVLYVGLSLILKIQEAMLVKDLLLEKAGKIWKIRSK